jgi:Bacterial Ig-like domain
MKMPVSRRAIAAAVPCCLLAVLAPGCHRGSDPAPPTPPADVTPPQVASRYPAAGDANGTLPFSVTFDEPLDAATVTRDSVRVHRLSGAIPSAVALSADGKTITITPAVPLDVPTWVEVELTNGLKDRAGNPFHAERSPWVFDVPVWARLGGGPISDEDGFNPWATLALDALGRPVVGMANLYPDFAVRFERGAWVPLTTPSSTIHASIAAGPNGEVWHADASWGHAIVVNRLTDRGWVPVAPPIAVDPGRYPWIPRVASTPSGPVVAWAEGISDGMGGLAGAAARADAFRAGAWQGWGDGPHALWDAIGASASGEVFAVWTSAGATVARLGDTVEYLPSPAAVVNGIASIAVGEDGSPFVAFADGAGVWVKRWDGASWVDVGGALGDAAPPGSSLPAIALDAGGAPVVAWNEGAYGSRKLLVARFDGASWTRLGGPLNASSAHDAYCVALALDARGLPVVAWAEATGGTRNDGMGTPHPVYRFHAVRMNR